MHKDRLCTSPADQGDPMVTHSRAAKGTGLCHSVKVPHYSTIWSHEAER